MIHKENDSIALKLVGNAPKLPIPGATASANEGLQWTADRSQGSLKSACHQGGECAYTTLYTLKHLRPKHHLWPFGEMKVTYASHGTAAVEVESAGRHATPGGDNPIQAKHQHSKEQREPTLVHE